MDQEEATYGALIIRFFGGFAVELGGAPLRRLNSPKGLRVLAYLALDAGRSVEKTVLAQEIWPDSTNARDNLDRTLRDLRRALGDPPRKPVRLCLVGHGRLQLQLQRADSIDTRRFEQLLQREDAASLQKAVDLYQGALLEGWGSQEGEAWIGERRERYQRQFVEALTRLRTLTMADGDYETVLGYLRLQRRAGEKEDSGWCDLIRAYLAKRDFENAALVYRQFTADVSAPSPEMSALWAQIPASEANAAQDRLLADLPRYFTSLIGRDEELPAIQTKVKSGSSRLLVLTGSGGMGKTRLAIALAHRRSGDFAQGVRFVDLTAATDPSSVLLAICSAFRVAGKQELIRGLQTKEILLLLDNCEQVLAACRDLTHELLMSCPHLHIVATSRRVFNIGEIVWDVPGLTLPPASASVTPEALLFFSATRLFYERAQAIRRTFELTPDNAPAIAEICRRLDGTPLAIELAAVRTRSLAPEEIAARLGDRFALLNRGFHNAPPRQQTLLATIAWSYDLLREDERRLFRRLSVFVGGWTEAAAIAVCTGDGLDVTRIEELLEELADQSLVVRSGASLRRFRMLETLLEYAAERLAEDRVEDRLCRKKHRDYFLQQVMQANLEKSTEQQEELYHTLEGEYYNLDQALLFCAQNPEEVQEGLRLGAALQEFWWIRGYLSVGRERLRALLEHPDAQERTQARAAALDGAGVLAYMQGDFAAARALHEESLEIFQELGHDRLAAYALGNLGIAVWFQEEASLARSLIQESLEMHRKVQNEEGIAYCLGNLGNMAEAQKDYVAARAWMEESLEILRKQKHDSGMAGCLGNLGNIACKLQDYTASYALQAESLMIKSRLQDKLGIALSLEGMAVLAFTEGRMEQSVCLWAAEGRLRKELGSPRSAESQADCDRQRAAALPKLGEERLSDALAKGQSMSLEEAIKYALLRKATL